MRAFCLEYGVALHQGAGIFKLELPHALKDEGNDLSPMMRRLVGDHYNDLCRLEERIRQVTREIEAVANREDITRRPSLRHVDPLFRHYCSRALQSSQKRQVKAGYLRS